MCKITARMHQAAALQLHPPFPFKLDKKGCIIILLNSVCLDNTCRYKTHMMKQRIHARDHCGTLHPNAGRPSLHKNRAFRFHTAKGKIKLQYTQRGGILSSIYWFTSGFSVSFFRLALPSSDTKDVVGQDRWREWFVNGQGTVRFYSTRFSPRSVLFFRRKLIVWASRRRGRTVELWGPDAQERSAAPLQLWPPAGVMLRLLWLWAGGRWWWFSTEVSVSTWLCLFSPPLPSLSLPPPPPSFGWWCWREISASVQRQRGWRVWGKRGTEFILATRGNIVNRQCTASNGNYFWTVNKQTIQTVIQK